MKVYIKKKWNYEAYEARFRVDASRLGELTNFHRRVEHVRTLGSYASIKWPRLPVRAPRRTCTCCLGCSRTLLPRAPNAYKYSAAILAWISCNSSHTISRFESVIISSSSILRSYVYSCGLEHRKSEVCKKNCSKKVEDRRIARSHIFSAVNWIVRKSRWLTL